MKPYTKFEYDDEIADDGEPLKDGQSLRVSVALMDAAAQPTDAAGDAWSFLDDTAPAPDWNFLDDTAPAPEWAFLEGQR